jgi:hypothetical protein
MFKKYWIQLLGIGFIFLAFLYMLKTAFDTGLLPEVAKVVIGLAFAASAYFVSYIIFGKGQKTASEIIAGLGTCILYGTFAFAAFSPKISLSANTLIICMVATSSILTYLGYQFQMRILTLISILGGLITPIVIKAMPEQVNLLFAYVLIINIAAMFLEDVKFLVEII